MMRCQNQLAACLICHEGMIMSNGYDPGSEIFDVVIKTNNSFQQASIGIREKEPPPNLRTRIDLIDSLWVGRLPPGLSSEIIKACWPAYYPKQPTIHFRQLYSFVREYPSNSSGKWDADKKLQESIIPIDDPAREYAFVREKRSWHTESDLFSLKELMGAWVSNSGLLSERVRRAFWYHEYASRTYYIDIRWTFIVTALEALLNTHREQVLKQFKERIPQLCKLLGISELSKKEAEQAYTLRSKMAHGGTIDALDSRNKELYLKIEEILREAVKQSILKPKTAQIFKDAQTVREKLPV